MSLKAPNVDAPLLEIRWREMLTRMLNELYRPNQKKVTTTYTALLSDSFLICDATGGAFTVTLPPATGNISARMIFKRINSGANAVTISRSGSETIDGATSQSLASQWAVLRLHSDGSNWLTF